MRVIERCIECEPDAVYRFYPMTDWHVGPIFCDEELLRADVAKIKADPYALWANLGDAADFINRKDKRFRESNLSPWLYGVDDIAAKQVERVIAIADPIADQCLAWCKGNHEDEILCNSEHDVYSELVSHFTKPGRKLRLGYAGWVVLRWQWGKKAGKKGSGAHARVWTTKLYLNHGAGGGALAGGDALMLERLGLWYDFDVACIGHRHAVRVIPTTHWGPSPQANRIVCQSRYAALCGSYLRGFDEDVATESYAERKSLPSRAVGGLHFEFRPGEQKISVIV